MTSASSAPDVVTRDAATVMLVRDVPAFDGGGLEVFMLRRNLQSDFVGGAYVFPGGAVDPDDRHANLEPICTGRSDANASEQLGIDGGGLAFWVAAIRECFEEAGVLLAYDRNHNVVRLTDDPDTEARFLVHREAVDTGARRLVDICADEGLHLAVDTIYYFSHWITPEGAPRRYDTRFFVARAPDGQVPLHDNREAIANLWIRPSDALARHRAGDYELIYPTMRSLLALEQFSSADEVLLHAATIAEVPAIQPRIVEDEGGGYRIVLPDDPEYQLVTPAQLPEGVPMNKLDMRSQAASSSTGPTTSADAAGGQFHG